MANPVAASDLTSRLALREDAGPLGGVVGGGVELRDAHRRGGEANEERPRRAAGAVRQR
jgi:hypothetical protein